MSLWAGVGAFRVIFWWDDQNMFPLVLATFSVIPLNSAVHNHNTTLQRMAANPASFCYSNFSSALPALFYTFSPSRGSLLPPSPLQLASSGYHGRLFWVPRWATSASQPLTDGVQGVPEGTEEDWGYIGGPRGDRIE